MRALRLRLILLAVIFVTGCTGCPLDPFGGDGQRLVIVSYNCQNLFDDVDHGTEYHQYDPSGDSWNTDAYLGKLAGIATAIRKAPYEPDVLLLQEVENRRVIERLAEDFLPLYDYHFFAAPIVEGAAFQTGIASRKEVVDLKIHRPGSRDGERGILEVRILADGDELVLFNNHWKSRLGGSEETEPQRIRAALMLKRRLETLAAGFPEIPVLLAGDFNEDPFETRDYPAALGAPGAVPEAPVFTVVTPSEEPFDNSGTVLFSEWASADEPGSYNYSGEWSRIDHFFWTGSLSDGSGWEVVEFHVIDDPLLLTEYGTPLSYDGGSLTGYSDHLPLLIVLEKTG